MDAKTIVERLIERNQTIACAESCTGGGLAVAITDITGASRCFGYGLVTYSNEAKQKLLNVPISTINRHGAVSAETAAAMAEGLLLLSRADIAVSITGIAGPGGSSASKPVGLVFIAVISADYRVVKQFFFDGPRIKVRRSSVEAAINMVGDYLEDKNI